MNILVLGGSYFLGKYFVKAAMDRHSITVFNRGNCPLRLPSVQEIYGDRHDKAKLAGLKGTHYDAIVDFCAYDENDIRLIFEVLDADFSQYIFISTCDVYQRGSFELLAEDAPFEVRDFGGTAGGYIRGKVALEKELKVCAEGYGVSFTSIRPAFIYGPGNYAPREGIYFNWIEKAGQILHPQDADGEFQLVYVKDVAKAALEAIGNPAAYNQAYNLAPETMETYESFADALKDCAGKKFERIPVTVAQVNEGNIPLPFPLTHEESNWYDGRKALALIGQYTSLLDGMKETADKGMVQKQ